MFDPNPELDALLASLQHPELAEIEPGLERVLALLKALGDPHLNVPPVIHVAGTNGKGSTIAYIDAILTTAGYRVHRYTSPHLIRFSERILLGGTPIAEGDLIEKIEKVKALLEKHPVTFFEATTAIALLAFAENPADIVLLETGMGGRLDATNVIPNPLATVITPIAMDHQEFLGETITKIAEEKAAIMKPGSPCVIAPQQEAALTALKDHAAQHAIACYQYKHHWNFEQGPQNWTYTSPSIRFELPYPILQGKHQLANAATAIAMVEQLKGWQMDITHIQQAMKQVQWPGRLQEISEGVLDDTLPLSVEEIWIDGGHNADAAQALADWMANKNDLPWLVVCAMVSRKDVEAFLTPLAPHISHLVATELAEKKYTMQAKIIADTAKKIGINGEVAPTWGEVTQAIEKYNNKPFRLLFCGSLYWVGELLTRNSTSTEI